MEDRLIDLESKIAYQEITLDELNDAIIRQQQEIRAWSNGFNRSSNTCVSAKRIRVPTITSGFDRWPQFPKFVTGGIKQLGGPLLYSSLPDRSPLGR